MNKIDEDRFERFVDGESFEKISQDDKVTLNTVISSVSDVLRWKHSFIYYNINLKCESYLGDINVIIEINDAIEDYPYKKGRGNCDCLWSCGIYKRNEKLFRDLSFSLVNDKLNIFGKKRFFSVQTIRKNYRTKSHDSRLISNILNSMPRGSELINIIDKEELYAIFSVPEYSIYK